jgi:hypothetical protein
MGWEESVEVESHSEFSSQSGVESRVGVESIRGWVPVRVESIRGWVPVGVESQSGLSPFGVQSIRSSVPFGVQSHSGLGPFGVQSHSGFNPFGVESHSGLGPFGVQSIRGSVHSRLSLSRFGLSRFSRSRFSRWIAYWYLNCKMLPSIHIKLHLLGICTVWNMYNYVLSSVNCRNLESVALVAWRTYLPDLWAWFLRRRYRYLPDCSAKLIQQ